MSDVEQPRWSEVVDAICDFRTTEISMDDTLGRIRSALKGDAEAVALASCARCGNLIVVPEADPRNQEMAVCGDCGFTLGVEHAKEKCCTERGAAA